MTDRIRIEIEGRTRFEGSRERGGRSYLPDAGGASLSLGVPVGVLLGGVDIERAKINDGIPFVVSRAGRHEMTLVSGDERFGPGEFLVYGEKVFDVNTDMMGEMLREISG